MEKLKTENTVDTERRLWRVSDRLEKAFVVLQELTEEYFHKYSDSSEDAKFAIVYEFSRYKTFTDIITDYVFQARKEIKELEELNKK
ncbi:hypothetical protein [Acetivibrio cellulolyticus]|uniref:hypothetical protein n=1 Tax=Acetivibrio cellulolyticus TaxID=35830 RepID=UPI0001E2D978|nr:hypothetical protein [Acetivibrio cellulolyticus]